MAAMLLPRCALPPPPQAPEGRRAERGGQAAAGGTGCAAIEGRDDRVMVGAEGSSWDATVFDSAITGRGRAVEGSVGGAIMASIGARGFSERLPRGTSLASVGARGPSEGLPRGTSLARRWWRGPAAAASVRRGEGGAAAARARRAGEAGGDSVLTSRGRREEARMGIIALLASRRPEEGERLSERLEEGDSRSGQRERPDGERRSGPEGESLSKPD